MLEFCIQHIILVLEVCIQNTMQVLEVCMLVVSLRGTVADDRPREGMQYLVYIKQGEHCSAQHSTAQHSTAQHCTAGAGAGIK